MGFNPVDIDMVKDSVDLVATIGRYVELKKAGNSWKGLCPFHREKTPSFIVTPARGTWKCFGCDAGGDVISFLQRMLGLDFLEVVEKLADESGINLKLTSDGKSRDKRSSLFKLAAAAQEFFIREFSSSGGRFAREYLAGRGIEEDRLQLGIGFAPTGNRLLGFLKDHGYSVSDMETAGLVRSGDSGPYDFFRNRLTFPIRDRRGRVVSFGGRALDDAKAKYLNGPETPIYSKGAFLYGYGRAVRYSREKNRVILVEGYFDHARLLDRGFEETVAASGTAFTEKQARNLIGMADRLLICYDGDAAGRKASVKVAGIIMSCGGFPEIIRLPDGVDPDDYLAERDASGFDSLIGSAMDPVSFCISLLGEDPGTGYRRVNVAKRLLEVVSTASNPLVEEELLRKVEAFTGYTRTALIKTVSGSSGAKRAGEGLLHGEEHLSRGDSTVLRAATAGGQLNRDLIRFLAEGDMSSSSGASILGELKRQVETGYSKVMLGEMEPRLADLCADISGILESVSSEELSSLKHAIERKRREVPRRQKLLKELSSADETRAAEILEDLKDPWSLRDRR